MVSLVPLMVASLYEPAQQGKGPIVPKIIF